jgi:single-stranded DNA-binding protein
MAWNNMVHIVGKVKRDARAVDVRKGLKALNFTLVVEVDGDKPLYVDCDAYGETVEELEGYVECDEELEVYGRLTHRTYTGNDGRVRTGMRVFVERVEEA